MSVALNNKVLRALDPDLPFLASEAAIDINNYLGNLSEDLDSVRNLAKILRNSIIDNNVDSPLKSSMDVSTLIILGEALLKVSRKQPPRQLNDLLQQASHMADVMSSENPKANIEELERAGDFCLALSKATAAYLISNHDPRPRHPLMV